MQREIYEVKKERFNIADRQKYILQVSGQRITKLK